MFLELECYIPILSIEVLKDFIFALLLDDHVQMIKSWKILFSLFELENFIFILVMNILKDFIFTLLLKATGVKKNDNRA